MICSRAKTWNRYTSAGCHLGANCSQWLVSNFLVVVVMPHPQPPPGPQLHIGLFQPGGYHVGTEVLVTTECCYSGLERGSLRGNFSAFCLTCEKKEQLLCSQYIPHDSEGSLWELNLKIIHLGNFWTGFVLSRALFTKEFVFGKQAYKPHSGGTAMLENVVGFRASPPRHPPKPRTSGNTVGKLPAPSSFTYMQSEIQRGEVTSYGVSWSVSEEWNLVPWLLVLCALQQPASTTHYMGSCSLLHVECRRYQ